MELKDIQTLIKFISTSGVDEVSIEQKDFKISIKKTQRSAEAVAYQPQLVQAVQAITPASVPQAATVNQTSETSVKVADEASNQAKTVEIKSPMIGTFYRSASPDKPAFVNVGDMISKGDVLCIVEAMKLFNEIESEIEGRIVKVLIDDANPVEYDQPLFLVEVK
jgi:acetyl-CoA carboxylase biotin carboxyl carrier protein